MTNAEKYTKEIIEIAKVNGTVAVNKNTEQICDCCHIDFDCCNCLFQTATGRSCDENRSKWFDTEYDLLAKYRDLPIDTHIYARNSETEPWTHQNFAGLTGDATHPFKAWTDGRTSWTSSHFDFKAWKYAKLDTD